MSWFRSPVVHLAALLASAALVLPAQVKLYVVTNPSTNAEQEVASGSLFDLGSTGPGDTIATRFRLRNTGVTTQQIQTMRVAGQGFTLSIPPLPYLLAPNSPTGMDFTIRFSGSGSGSYSASLTAGTIGVLLRANVLAGAVLVTEGTGGARTVVAAGTEVSLGNVQRGQKSARTFWLENRNTEAVTVRSIQVTGGSGGVFSYVGPALPAAGLSIAPGASASFDIEFAPAANQRYAAVLVVDGRSFPLSGTGFDPPLPKPSLVVESNAGLSGQQPKLTIPLASPAGGNITGTLRLDFQPVAGAGDDSAIRFVASPTGNAGVRNLSVQAREGESVLFIGNGSTVREAVFQTGTTAGEITLTLEIGPHKETVSVRVAEAAVSLESTSALRRTQDIDVSLTGFDNTRSISLAQFSFYDTSGRLLNAAPIRAEVQREFAQYYATSTTGGIFTMRATFPVQGPVAQIATVEVELQNSAGTTRTQRLNIQ